MREQEQVMTHRQGMFDQRLCDAVEHRRTAWLFTVFQDFRYELLSGIRDGIQSLVQLREFACRLQSLDFRLKIRQPFFFLSNRRLA
jgi:hypothetical protein